MGSTLLKRTRPSKVGGRREDPPSCTQHDIGIGGSSSTSLALGNLGSGFCPPIVSFSLLQEHGLLPRRSISPADIGRLHGKFAIPPAQRSTQGPSDSEYCSTRDLSESIHRHPFTAVGRLKLFQRVRRQRNTKSSIYFLWPVGVIDVNACAGWWSFQGRRRCHLECRESASTCAPTACYYYCILNMQRNISPAARGRHDIYRP